MSAIYLIHALKVLANFHLSSYIRLVLKVNIKKSPVKQIQKRILLKFFASKSSAVKKVSINKLLAHVWMHFIEISHCHMVQLKFGIYKIGLQNITVNSKMTK